MPGGGDGGGEDGGTTIFGVEVRVLGWNPAVVTKQRFTTSLPAVEMNFQNVGSVIEPLDLP